MANSRLYAEKPVLTEISPGTFAWRTNYQISPPITVDGGQVTNGTYDLPADNQMTETTINSTIATGIAAKANEDTLANPQGFTSDDVIGGRI